MRTSGEEVWDLYKPGVLVCFSGRCVFCLSVHRSTYVCVRMFLNEWRLGISCKKSPRLSWVGCTCCCSRSLLVGGIGVLQGVVVSSASCPCFVLLFTSLSAAIGCWSSDETRLTARQTCLRSGKGGGLLPRPHSEQRRQGVVCLAFLPEKTHAPHVYSGRAFMNQSNRRVPAEFYLCQNCRGMCSVCLDQSRRDDTDVRCHQCYRIFHSSCLDMYAFRVYGVH